MVELEMLLDTSHLVLEVIETVAAQLIHASWQCTGHHCTAYFYKV